MLESLLNKVTGPQTSVLSLQVFPSEICDIFKNTIFHWTLAVAAPKMMDNVRWTNWLSSRLQPNVSLYYMENFIAGQKWDAPCKVKILEMAALVGK